MSVDNNTSTNLFYPQEKNRINKDGYLILQSEKTRKQILNQADCLDKLRSIVRTACKKEKVPSAEDIQLMNQRLAVFMNYTRYSEMISHLNRHQIGCYAATA